MAAVPIADPTMRKKKLNLMNDEIPSLLKPIGFEPEYIQMIKLKTSEPFILCVKLMILHSTNNFLFSNILVFI